jgi:single-strand DNA-binding protein
MTYHTIIIAGNLGNDPEMRYTPDGTAVCDFSVAVNESFTNREGERVDRTIWFRVTTWRKLAETCNAYLKKGRKVLVEGRLVADPNTGGPKIWERQDGSSGANFEITAQTVRFLSSRGESDEGYQVKENEEDIPF